MAKQDLPKVHLHILTKENPSSLVTR